METLETSEYEKIKDSLKYYRTSDDKNRMWIKLKGISSKSVSREKTHKPTLIGSKQAD